MHRDNFTSGQRIGGVLPARLHAKVAVDLRELQLEFELVIAELFLGPNVGVARPTGLHDLQVLGCPGARLGLTFPAGHVLGREQRAENAAWRLGARRQLPDFDVAKAPLAAPFAPKRPQTDGARARLFALERRHGLTVTKN